MAVGLNKLAHQLAINRVPSRGDEYGIASGTAIFPVDAGSQANRSLGHADKQDWPG